MKNDIFIVIACVAALVLALGQTQYGSAYDMSYLDNDSFFQAMVTSVEQDEQASLEQDVQASPEKYVQATVEPEQNGQEFSQQNPSLIPIEFESILWSELQSQTTTEPTPSPLKTYPNLLEAIGDHPKLIRLTMLLASDHLADVRSILASYQGPLTLFAPSDAAVVRSELDQLPNDMMKATILYHMVGRALMAKDIRPSQIVDTMLTHPTMVLLGNDVQGHAIPQRFKLTKRNGVVEVVAGEQRSWAMDVDFRCDNGVLHVVDEVIQLPKSVVDMASSSYLTSFVKLIENAGVSTDTLNETPDTTFFIPTNQAIRNEKSIQSMNPAMLASILRNHMVSGVHYSVELRDQEIIPTFTATQALRIEKKNGALKVGGANVLWTDIPVQNGVVHVIDRMLIGST